MNQKKNADIALVTGAAGFLGVNLVRRLLAHGHKVRGLIRKTSRMIGLEGLDIDLRYGDVQDYGSIREAMEGCRWVYHVAARVQIGPYRYKDFYQTNVIGTKNVCEAVLACDVEKMVLTSSIAAIGYGTKENPATEESDYNFGKFKIPYNETKRLSEKVVLDYVKNNGLKATIVNPPYMLGPWDAKPTSNEIIRSTLKAPVLIYPPGGLCLMDVEDAAEGHILAIEKGRIGERYILMSENLSYKELFELILKTVGKEKKMFPLNASILRLAGKFGDALGYIGEKNYLLNSSIVASMITGHYCDASKAVKELGIPQNPIEGAIKKSYDWFKENGYL